MSSGVAAFVGSLLQCPKIGPQITCHREFEALAPEFGANRLPWSVPVANLLKQAGMSLYSHQADATDHIRAGHSIVVSTPTASGKSLIYNLPVLDMRLRDPDARALYLFPLKALAQDQLLAFRALCASWPEAARPTADIYDGDTSDYRRRRIRNDPPTALLTNPEMLHLSLLPFHQSWTTFLANLSYVIVDEAHIYRGVFGSHMAQVFRRLNRIAGLYGANPVYIFCTATLGNPDELAGRLLGRSQNPVLIHRSGAPRGKRHFILVNPDNSAATCAIDLLKRSLEQGLRVIVYCHTRRMAELISIWAGSESGEWQNRISSYRAGYLPEERREIEARMASGELQAVVSTSALELGIDIGGLDVCILVGYPGTVTQTLQRGGRVGRAGQESVVILVAGDDAMDQYFARHPDNFFSRPPERAAINPDNESILKRHLECAAAELPLVASEPWLQGQAAQKMALALEREGLLARSADGSQLIAQRKRPQRQVDLRGSGSSYILEDGNGAIVGTIDGFCAWKETHPGAVYLHHGRSYVIRELDSGRMRIRMEHEKTGWFTRVRSRKQTEILSCDRRKSLGSSAIMAGRLRITETITGYERRATAGNRLLNVTPLQAPPQIYETDGIWFVIPDAIRLLLEAEFLHFMGSIHALEHAVIALLPLEVMADRNDFGGISIPVHPQIGLPAVFIYDGLPGGAGLCSAAYDRAGELLQATLCAIAECKCEDGCPGCIQSPKCGAGNRPLSKAGAQRLLREMLAPGSAGAEICSAVEIMPAADFSALEIPAPAMKLQFPEQPQVAQTASQAAPPANYVVLDVETRRSAAEVGGWHNADQMGVSVAVLYDSSADSYIAYEQDRLAEMFARMASASLVIGFNTLRFDYKVLAPFAAASQPEFAGLHQLPSLDLLLKVSERLNYRVGLDNLCRATLNAPKSTDGLQALRWWQEGNLDEIRAYCRRDVELTRELYLFGLRNGYVLFTNKAGAKTRVPVDFTFQSSG